MTKQELIEKIDNYYKTNVLDTPEIRELKELLLTKCLRR